MISVTSSTSVEKIVVESSSMEISGSITSVTDSLSSARLMVVVSIGSDEVVFITGNLFNLKRSPMLKTGFVVSGNSVVVLVTGFLLDLKKIERTNSIKKKKVHGSFNTS